MLLIIGLSWSAGLIHVQAAITHLDEYVPHSVFFALLAAAQLAWGVAVCRRGARGFLAAGAALNLAVIVLWVFSRTTGLPFGPEAGGPEAVGGLDSLASADELALVILVLEQLRDRPPAGRNRVLDRLSQAAAVSLVLLSALAFTLLADGH